MAIVVMFRRLGPYHHARLNAAAKCFNLTAIDLSATDDTYAWEKVDGPANFRRLTLFEDGDPNIRQNLEVWRRVSMALNDCEAHVVAINGWAEKGALAALHWCLTGGVPAIVMSDSHLNDSPRVWWKEKVKKCLLRCFSSALVGGQPHIEYLQLLGMPADRIFSGYDVVDNDYFANVAGLARQNSAAMRVRYNLPKRYFLASNRFIPKKNLFRLLQAYAKYRAMAGFNAWRFVLLGDGVEMDNIVRIRDELDLGDDVVLPGFKQYDEIPIYYALAGAFVHASTTEQWGLVINEAMASGLPILVSKTCGCVPDLVKQGQNGYNFDPYNINELADYMLKMSSQECDLESMGKKSHEIINNWSPRVFAENLWAAAQVAISKPPLRHGILSKTILWGLLRR